MSRAACPRAANCIADSPTMPSSTPGQWNLPLSGRLIGTGLPSQKAAARLVRKQKITPENEVSIQPTTSQAAQIDRRVPMVKVLANVAIDAALFCLGARIPHGRQM